MPLQKVISPYLSRRAARADHIIADSACGFCVHLIEIRATAQSPSGGYLSFFNGGELIVQPEAHLGPTQESLIHLDLVGPGRSKEDSEVTKWSPSDLWVANAGMS